MATTEDLQAIVRHLNGVKSAAQARAAIGAATIALSKAYPVAKRLPSDRARAGTRALDLARTPLESWFRQIKDMSATASIERDWPKKRQLIHAAYTVIGGIEAEAQHKPETSNLDILATSIKEAPGVFGKAVGSVAKEVGSTAGSAVGGIFAGLGISGTLTVVVILLVVFVVLKRGTLLGRLLG